MNILGFALCWTVLLRKMCDRNCRFKNMNSMSGAPSISWKLGRQQTLLPPGWIPPPRRSSAPLSFAARGGPLVPEEGKIVGSTRAAGKRKIVKGRAAAKGKIVKGRDDSDEDEKPY
ncbi:unnamed protein product [Cuscuta campestris]|uniref:Uncharacterized protein n=1 Tax=Cuscuta campestris TaxID=132261 RepID=A0A484KFT4_9ASTE|nr:unnamed protein product [Cuscuta campestris]